MNDNDKAKIGLKIDCLSAKIIVDFLNEQFELYLKEELKVNRSLVDYEDTRIHACLYFISPTGHGYF